MQITEMIEAVQHKLGVAVDGKAGPETWAAIYRHIVDPQTDTTPLIENLSVVDARSEKIISSLLPQVQPMARALVQKAAATGIKIKILSGFRTYAEQDALYAKGRSAPGAVVTNARAGYSNHNFGIAFDVGVFAGNTYLGDSSKYKAVGALGVDIGLEWGGNWTTIVDQPHFQLRPSWAAQLSEKKMLAELRARVADKRAIYA